MEKINKKLSIAALILFFSVVFSLELLLFSSQNAPYIWLFNIDNSILDYFAAIKTSFLTDLFFWITIFGNWEILAGIIPLFLYFLWISRQRIYIFMTIFSIFFSSFFSFLTKIHYKRDRPLSAFFHESSFSFPSAHAMIAVAFYGAVSYIIFNNLKTKVSKLILLIISFLFISALGISRLYFQVHYFSDVLYGFLIGSVWLLSSILLTKYLITKEKLETEWKLKSINKQEFFFGLIFFFFIYFAIATYLQKEMGL